MKGRAVDVASKYESDEEGFVKFTDIARGELHQQAQYASRYIDGSMEGYPNLGKGLRIEGDPTDYYSIKIHKDDVKEFVDRVTTYKKISGNHLV